MFGLGNGTAGLGGRGRGLTIGDILEERFRVNRHAQPCRKLAQHLEIVPLGLARVLGDVLGNDVLLGCLAIQIIPAAAEQRHDVRKARRHDCVVC